MPKVRIPVEELPAPNEDGTHLIRFRVSSEDRNSISEWSKLFQIESIGQVYPQSSVYSLQAGSNVFNISWDTPSYYNVSPSGIGASVLHNHGNEWKQHDADVFISINNSASSNFVYWWRSSDNTFTIILQQYINQYEPEITAEDIDDIRIIVQVASKPPHVVNPLFTFVDTGIVALV